MQYGTSEELLSPRSEASTNQYIQHSALDSTPTPSPSSCISSKSLIRKKRHKVHKADEVLEKVSKQLDYVQEDKFGVSDIIFEAQMGNVTKRSKMVLQNSQQPCNYMYSSQENMPFAVQHGQLQPQENIGKTIG